MTKVHQKILLSIVENSVSEFCWTEKEIEEEDKEKTESEDESQLASNTSTLKFASSESPETVPISSVSSHDVIHFDRQLSVFKRSQFPRAETAM